MKAAVYARYSSDNQREESIEAQTRAIKEYAEKNGIQIVKVYADEARSATTDNRPQFLQMIKDSDLGLFNVLIVHKLDRFARNRYDSAFYKRHLKKNGVRLVSVLENLDDSPEAIILESVLEGMAEYYSANLAREVMKGMKETALQCKHTGGMAPLGYDVAPDKTYVINEAEAKSVKIIFDMYINGSGYALIGEKLNSEGFRTKTGKLFSRSSMHDILKNEKYTGTYVFNRTARKTGDKRTHRKSKDESEIIKIKDGMPRIIDDETWIKVCEKMSDNKRGANSAREIYLLSGLLFCGKCGGAMTGNRKKAGRNKTLYKSYECSTRKRTKGCDMKSVGKEYIEALVIDQLVEDVFSPSAIENIVNHVSEYAETQSSEISKDIALIEKELSSVSAEIDNIVNAIASGMFHTSMKEKMDSLEQKKSGLSLRLAEAKLQLDIHLPTEAMIRGYLEKDTDIKNKSLNDQKKIIQTYVNRIIVCDNDITVDTIVTFAGGGGGSRTHVRKCFTRNFSECSHCFKVSPSQTPNDRIPVRLSPISLLEVGEPQ
ncbi:hypothetical protein EUAN_12750 [Andreesenia angusta]|uniref:Transposon gamma-delta resolvase n=1 Tax=Andreesenia angusta TaxID=39480 RepID=A0A1S1V6D8_9FIRM|nr:hypothetical protein EUAN_12750 [Andreesenia angusta]